MKVKKLIKKLKKILKKYGNEEAGVVFDSETRLVYSVKDVYVHPVIDLCVIDAGRN